MEQYFLITSEFGIHARPATRMVNLAMSFHSEIDLCLNDKTVNLKSIMGLMSLGIYKGELIKIIVSGSDAEKAMSSIADFILTENLGRLV
ncbi:MAG: HPr family phosphocarrier protein [Firmicutes bacterium]|nr:HPr family phosphocarrier protein [Bacillota bacterium]